jgi:precorrin-2/cobalt-factor-2 C20-methyltransferase
MAIDATTTRDPSDGESGAARPGHFYAVGVGPGAPDLLTFRAANLIRSADVVIAPRSRTSDESLALTTVAELIHGQEVVEHFYAMTRDVEATIGRWREIAGLVDQRCQAGQAVVQITIGDPLIYSTSHYLLTLVRKTLPAERIHVVPGISAFQSVASHFPESLVSQEDRLLLMPATDLDRVEEALTHCETLVLYKVGKRWDQLVDLLRRKRLLDQARLVSYSDQPGKECITADLADVENERGYMATVIVYIDRKEWSADAKRQSETSPQ